MGLIQLYSTTDNTSQSRCSADKITFCDCGQSASNLTSSSKKTERIKDENEFSNVVKCSDIALDICKCGEDTCTTIDWSWDTQNIQPQTFINNHTVEFHPFYSQGSSVVRSNQQLLLNMIHYWEIKISNWFSGTDLMVGIGTDALDLQEYRYKFASVLGLDERSWGYSHRGMIQHKNVFKYYGRSFTKQCIVGVYLDLSLGHLEFYVNRKPQGIAYRDIPLNKKLFAMVCSTSARSSVRLINASSIRDSLQFRCMEVISRYHQLLDEVQRIPGLAHLCRNMWFLFPKERYQYNQIQKAESSSSDSKDIENIESPDEYQEESENKIDAAMDEAIFFSTFRDTNGGLAYQDDDEDDEPMYCDED